MKRVARMVIISAVVIAAVTAALAVAEAGRYQGVKRIPTVQISQPRRHRPPRRRPPSLLRRSPPLLPAHSRLRPKPKAKAKTKQRVEARTQGESQEGHARSEDLGEGAPISDHEPTREVVKRKVRDESDEHDGDRTAPQTPSSSDSND